MPEQLHEALGKGEGLTNRARAARRNPPCDIRFRSDRDDLREEELCRQAEAWAARLGRTGGESG